MIQRFLQLHPAIHAVCQLEVRLQVYTLSNEDWIHLVELQSILQVFVRATEQLSGHSYPTLSSQLPYFVVLALRLEESIEQMWVKDPESDLLYTVNSAWEKLDHYHSLTGSAQAIATIPDPRYKLTTFRNLPGNKSGSILHKHVFIEYILNNMLQQSEIILIYLIYSMNQIQMTFFKLFLVKKYHNEHPLVYHLN